jgi:SAM-dependent methyltransferase
MEPNAFVAEVYRRMSLRSLPQACVPPSQERVAFVAEEYRPFLPENKDAKVLDIGFGDGWFMAACLKLGYLNVSGAEFNPDSKRYLKDWGIQLHKIEKNIGDFLASHREEYDFIHLSHVIEHIPKYSLLWVVDSIYQALKKGGRVFLRTPNMEGPTPNSSYYVTLGHEYGFAGSNLKSLLSICGFDDVKFCSPKSEGRLRQLAGRTLRWPILQSSKIRHRLFGVNQGGQFGTELIVMATRKDFPPLFDQQYR